MTIVILSNVRAVLRAAPQSVMETLDEALSFEVPGREFMPKFKRGYWDGRRHLFSARTGLFPTGLLHRVRKLLPGTKVVDRRPNILPPPDSSKIHAGMLRGVTLRDYQIEAAKAILENQRGIFQMATNSGKTKTAAAVIKALPGISVLFVVHTKILLKQVRRELAEAFGVIEDVIGEIGDGHCRVARITVGIVNSLVLKIKTDSKIRNWVRNEVNLFVQDECHHSKSRQFYSVAMACNAQFRIGMSGTPFQSIEDKMLVEATTGPVLIQVTNDQLVESGISAKPRVEIVSYDAVNMDDAWEWVRVYRDGVVQNVSRNSAILASVERLRVAGKQVLILVSHVWHGNILAAMLRASGHSFEFVHAKIPLSEIEASKDRFEAREFGVLMASPVFGEGVSIPAIEALIIADGGKSVRKILQQVGRALRKKTSGDNRVTIVDFKDTNHVFLERHAEERVAIYRAEKFSVVEM